jgi:hypothetical protein
MATFSGADVVPARVINEDDDFMILEVAKHEGVTWRVAPIPGDTDPQPVEFRTILFCKFEGGQPTFKKPWD